MDKPYGDVSNHKLYAAFFFFNIYLGWCLKIFIEEKEEAAAEEGGGGGGNSGGSSAGNKKNMKMAMTMTKII